MESVGKAVPSTSAGALGLGRARSAAAARAAQSHDAVAPLATRHELAELRLPVVRSLRHRSSYVARWRCHGSGATVTVRHTVREVILYEYAKLIADAAIDGRDGLAPAQRKGSQYWSFTIATYHRLLRDEIKPSAILRENKLMVTAANSCAYCGVGGELQWEHIIPRSRGGPDTIDNMVRACPPCNLRKGDRYLLDWHSQTREVIPRLVMGKLLKLLFGAHRDNGTLGASEFPPGQGLRLGQLALVFMPQTSHVAGGS